MPDHTHNTHTAHCTITTHHNTTINPSEPMVIGVDEVGRGCLFGHMSVAAVIMPTYLTGYLSELELSKTPLAALNDSKKLTPKKRMHLCTHIQELSCGYVLIDVPATVIDTINIYQATLLGMRLAIEQLLGWHQANKATTTILIDGNAKPMLSADFLGFKDNISTLIQGDGKHSSIACASILAKVHRDDSMMAFAERYPDYHLDKHKGYASKAHTDAIKRFGILPEHRKSFNPMRTMLANQATPTISTIQDNLS